MASRAPSRVLLTIDEYLAIEDDDDNVQHELVDGVVVVTPSPAAAHGLVATTVTIEVGTYVRATGLGVAFGDNVGYVLSRHPDTVRIPDASFIRADRVPPDGFGRERVLDGAPDLAVEVLSPCNRAADVAGKVERYLASGGRLVWAIDPARRTVAVHTVAGGVRTMGEADTLDGGDVLPGFTVAVARLFVGIRREGIAP